jgi:hypothetical protein
VNKIDLILQGSFTNYTYEVALHYYKLPFVNKIIISCWDQDITPPSNDILFVKSLDVSFPGLGNRNRQIKSSFEGLKKSSTEFSVKLRTDQKISLDSMCLMYDFYNKHKKQDLHFSNGLKPKNKICVAGIFRPFPFHPRDHIFWGNTNDLLELFNIPYDVVSLNDDYTKYIRSEAYICMWYFAKFDIEIQHYINNYKLYLVDNAPLIKDALVKSNDLGPKIFQPFPKIDFEWPKYGLSKYHYDFTENQLGEYWGDDW